MRAGDEKFILILVVVYAIIKIVGVDCGEGPPVPIPNTAVKLTHAEDTCLETDWKNRSTPTQSSRVSRELFHAISRICQLLTAVKY